MAKPVRIAFVCIGNTSRSQMAESWARRFAADRGLGNRVQIASAGTRPGTAIRDCTRDIMAQVGCTMECQGPKPLQSLEGTPDWLILMGEGVDCPPLGEGQREDWGFPDLDGNDLASLVAMRDAIGQRVADLLNRLTFPGAPKF